MVASPEAFERIFVKLVSYTYNKTVNINYCSVFSDSHENQLKKLVICWCDLNEESYNVRYKENDNSKLSAFLNLRFAGETINTYQLLKCLEFIDYNTEVREIEKTRILTAYEKEAINTLKRAISEIKSQIIEELPEYQAAKWSY